MTDAELLTVLEWLAGPQPHATSPSAHHLGEVRSLAYARDHGGRIELTDAGRDRLDALCRATGITP